MRKETVEQVEIKGENDCPKGNLHSLKIDKILLPLDFIYHASGPTAVLAHHFDSEIVLLHVVTPLSCPAGVFVDKHSQVAGICCTKSSHAHARNSMSLSAKNSKG